MSSAEKESSWAGELSPLEAVRAALNTVDDFVPQSDESKMAALKKEAENLRKLRKENSKLQKNEKRKRARILRKGSGWDQKDILECFRFKHENELRRQRSKLEREAKRSKSGIMSEETEITKTPTQREEPHS